MIRYCPRQQIEIDKLIIIDDEWYPSSIDRTRIYNNTWEPLITPKNRRKWSTIAAKTQIQSNWDRTKSRIDHRLVGNQIHIYDHKSEKLGEKKSLRIERETFLWRALSSLETLAFSFMAEIDKSKKEKNQQKRRKKKSWRKMIYVRRRRRSKQSFPPSALSISLFFFLSKTKSFSLPFQNERPRESDGVNTFWTVQIMLLVYLFGFAFLFQNWIWFGLVLFLLNSYQINISKKSQTYTWIVYEV